MALASEKNAAWAGERTKGPIKKGISTIMNPINIRMGNIGNMLRIILCIGTSIYAQQICL
jgi:hypothetical protein